ncbi:MAG: 6-carboxytetrahydropterin synthase QueD [Candidatus Altiarchaeota archaeon]|nr:6-carboxytetrahydropterin synthase QueD [Candidatus Altiarchaeota archaeon]
MKLGRIFYFDSAHYLPDYKGECEKFHGHTYKLEVVIEDNIKKDGMVLDFRKMKGIVEKSVLEKLDHQDLNKILKNPTAENIVEWIWKALEKKIPLYSVRLWEGEGKWVEKTLQ